LTVSPSLTRRSEPKSTTPTWPASRFMHMPLTPEANLQGVRPCKQDKLDGQPTRQAPQPGRWPCRAHGRYHHYGRSVSIAISLPPRAIPVFQRHPVMAATSLPSGPVLSCVAKHPSSCYVPDGQNAAGLGHVRLLLDTADSLLENRRDLGRRGLRFGICAGLEGRDGGCGISLSETS
jgi:hypothetical protein